MRLNTEQAKHLAETFRAVAFAQFAAFGYVAIQKQDYITFVVSTGLFFCLIAFAVLLLEDA
ncbi:MAG: hypothetical protein ACOY4D_05480 [Pseudomonadota bacterium]|jgi:hypothetical protein